METQLEQTHLIYISVPLWRTGCLPVVNVDGNHKCQTDVLIYCLILQYIPDLLGGCHEIHTSASGALCMQADGLIHVESVAVTALPEWNSYSKMRSEAPLNTLSSLSIL
jgi:hypothetical protein